MARTRRRAAATAELIGFLFRDVSDEPLAEELAGWMGTEPSFRAFVDEHRDKIHKKLRTASATAGRRDVRTELLVAHLLLADRRLELTFEPYGARGGPDFQVTIRGQPTFNLEVTRLRAAPDEGRLGGQLLAKLRQLPPSVPNAVLVAADLERADAVDLAAVIRRIRARADAKDEAFFLSHGFESAKSFYRRFLRLGGLLLFSEAATGPSRAALWLNPSPAMPLPERVARRSLELLQR